MLFYADMKKAELHAPQRSPGSLSKSAHFPRRYNSWQCEDTWLLLLPVDSDAIIPSFSQKDKGFFPFPGLDNRRPACYKCISSLDTLIRSNRKVRLLISLNYRDPRPIYEQLTDTLRRMILSGAIAENEKLPSVRELASRLSINPNTIARAYKALENEGFVYSVTGRGSFAGGLGDVDEGRKQALRQTLIHAATELRQLGESEEALITLIKETTDK
jgi:Predicted transcriptional regulators